MTAAGVRWRCPNCGVERASAYCPDCGERPLAPPDLTPRGVVLQALKALGGVDGRLLRSLRALILEPGTLTRAHANGQRRPYVGPFQLLLTVNVLFFAMQSLTHTKIFSSTLDSHLHRQDWSALAQQLVERRLETLQTTLAHFAPLFDQAAVLNAKSLVMLMVLPFVALLSLLLVRARHPFGVHLAFALHLYAFMLLLFCVSLAIEAIDRLAGGAGLEAGPIDKALTVFNLGMGGVYLHAALGRVYGSRGALRLLQTVLLTLAIFAILLGYRFAIFIVTLYMT